MEIKSCTVCYSQGFRYDEEHCRNVCNTCNAMQEITGVGITSYIDDINVNFQRLNKINLKRKVRLTGQEKKDMKYKNASPWELHNLFKWIFNKQVESMKPYVVDWDNFKKISENIWEKYSITTGKQFDITKESLDNIRMKKYPVGWGTEYDPKTGKNMLAKASSEFNKYKRSLIESDNENDIDYDKLDRNAKKMRVERMVCMKKLEKERKLVKEKEEKEKQNIFEEDKEEILNENIEELIDEKVEVNENLKNEKMEEMLNGFSSSEAESALSDEEDNDYLQIDFIDEKETKVVRALRKKKEHEVMWTGSFSRYASRYMESNITMLFLTLYYCLDKKAECYCLMDILRLVRAKVIPYIRIRRFIPNDEFCINDYSYHRFVLRDQTPSWEYIISSFTKILRDLNFGFLVEIDHEILIRRFIKDLNLPSDLYYIVNYIRKETKTINDMYIGAMKDSTLIRTNYKRMGRKYPYTLLPEPFCFAHILMAIKFILRLNADYELRVCELVKKLEQLEVIKKGELFIWTNWWEDMYKAPSISNCKNWEDIEKVQDPFAFLEKDDLDDNYERFADVGLESNEELNHRGRFVVYNKKSTHQDVLDKLENPFRQIFDSVNDLYNRKKVFNDYTESNSEYLFNPREFANSHRVEESLFSQDQENPNLVLEELVNLIEENNLTYERISYDKVDFNDNIFHKNFIENTTEIEDDLIRILTFNSGISRRSVLVYVRFLEKHLIDKSKKVRNRKKKN